MLLISFLNLCGGSTGKASFEKGGVCVMLHKSNHGATLSLL